jgi:hypothetical protein
MAKQILLQWWTTSDGLWEKPAIVFKYYSIQNKDSYTPSCTFSD